MAKEVPGTREYLIGQDVYIYKPEMSPDYWWISYKLKGLRRKHESLGRIKDFAQACMSAQDHYLQKKQRYDRMGEAGLVLKPTMDACFKYWFKHASAGAKGFGSSANRRKTIISHWQRFHLDYFGKNTEVSAHSPTQDEINGYITLM